jgi:hypothetical protein
MQAPMFAGDIGVVTADQLGVRAYLDAQERQHDEVDAQAHQHHYVRLARQHPGNSLQDPVDARPQFLVGQVVGRADQPAQAVAAVLRHSGVFC